MLTAKADEVDKIIGLEIGADGYITKPFSASKGGRPGSHGLRRTQEGAEAVRKRNLRFNESLHQLRVLFRSG